MWHMCFYGSQTIVSHSYDQLFKKHRETNFLPFWGEGNKHVTTVYRVLRTHRNEAQCGAGVCLTSAFHSLLVFL